MPGIVIIHTLFWLFFFRKRKTILSLSNTRASCIPWLFSYLMISKSIEKEKVNIIIIINSNNCMVKKILWFINAEMHGIYSIIYSLHLLNIMHEYCVWPKVERESILKVKMFMVNNFFNCHLSHLNDQVMYIFSH